MRVGCGSGTSRGRRGYNNSSLGYSQRHDVPIRGQPPAIEIGCKLLPFGRLETPRATVRTYRQRFFSESVKISIYSDVRNVITLTPIV